MPILIDATCGWTTEHDGLLRRFWRQIYLVTSQGELPLWAIKRLSMKLQIVKTPHWSDCMKKLTTENPFLHYEIKGNWLRIPQQNAIERNIPPHRLKQVS